MSQPPDIEALARRYLDLWQDQASALAGDAELARQLGRWLTLMQSGMAHAFQAAAAQMHLTVNNTTTLSGDFTSGTGTSTGLTIDGAGTLRLR